MRGYIAITDPGWYEHLAEEPGPREANFWKPSARSTVNLEPGTPYFFKLRAPHRAIAGFGFFASFTVLPDWLAWETFGDANGVGSLDALRERLGRIRAGARIDEDPQNRIGCSLIAEARFFAPGDWVDPPADWKPRTQSGAGYDLTRGEGLRVWDECRMRSAVELPLVSPEAERFGAPMLHRPRLGQGIFRVQVLDAYGRACAVSGEHSLPVLEAAHIRPYGQGGEHSVDNGLALRSDLHRLFDRGYATIDDDDRFVVSRRLKDDFDNGRSYVALHGTSVRSPARGVARPSPAALEWHRSNVYLG